jgi:hypothetical protein
MEHAQQTSAFDRFRQKSQDAVAASLKASEGDFRPESPPERRLSDSGTIRGNLLIQAHEATTRQRNVSYGDPMVNLSCAGELKRVVRSYMQANRHRTFSSAEEEAIDAICTKLGRIATGSPVGDNYVDGAAYFAIAGEANIQFQDIKG